MKPHENYSNYLIVGLVLTLLVVSGFTIYWIGQPARITEAAEDFSAERISMGRDIYNAQCATCHGSQGEGGVGFPLNSAVMLKNTPNEVLFSVIRSGVPSTQMPAWSVDYGGPLTDEDVRSVVAFIRNWEATAPIIEPETFVASPERGSLLFNSTCAICHGENGTGSDRAPAINDPARLSGLNSDWYRGVIRNGRPAKGMPTWGTVLSPDQIEDLIALIDTWREGEQVVTPYNVTGEIAAAIFSLQNEDPESALLRVERALTVADGPGAEILINAQVLLDEGDNAGALQTLLGLAEQWPIGDAVAGQPIYSERCAPCHGASGEGGVGPALVRNAFIQDNNNAAMVAFIQDGRSGTAMAGFGDRLTETEIADVVAFLRGWNPAP